MLKKARNVSFALLGVAGLVLNRRYSGPYNLNPADLEA